MLDYSAVKNGGLSMKRALLTGAAMLLAVSTTAFAESKPIVAGAGLSPNMTDDATNTVPPAATSAATTASPAAKPSGTAGLAPGDPGSPAEAAAAATGSASGIGAAAPTAGMGAGTGVAMKQRDLTADLGRAGFTDVNVKPGSWIVQAKDKSGDPVTLFISPGSVAVYAVADAGAQTAQANVDATTNKPTGSAGPFVSVPAGNDLSSQVVGLDIYNGSKQDIGTIKDIALGAHGVKAYIVGVGGFLGMGDHYVAVSPSAIKLSYNTNEKKWHAEMDTNAAQLKAAPEYKYPANS